MEKNKFFKDCKSLDDVKREYKRLAMLHHPDRGGDTAIMQMINKAYGEIMRDPFFRFAEQNDDAKDDFYKFPAIIEKIIGLDITIEICGNWIWISGNSYPYRLQLKKLGFQWAPQKYMWYWRPSDFISTNRSPKSMEYIRTTYGSDMVNTQFRNRAVREQEEKV